MRAIRAVFIANGIAQGIFFPFVAVILSSRGFSPVEIGVITAMSSAAFTIAVPAWGHLADVVLGRRSALVIAALAAAAVMVLAGSPIPALVVAACFVVFSLFESGWGPLADALAVNAVADRARDYARVRLLSSMGFAVSSAGVGLLYDRTGYGPAFGLCAAFAVALAIAARLTPDLPRADLARHAPGRARGGSMAVALQVQPRLRSVLVALFLVHIGIIAGFTYLPLRVVALGGNPFDVALVSSVGAFAEIPAMLLVGSVAARIGLRGLVAGSALLYAACFVGWAVLDSPTLIIATRFVSGIAFAGLWESWRPMEQADAPPLETFTILTTDPNELMEPVHNRMPVILEPKDYDRWLDTDEKAAPPAELLHPYAADQMRAWPVSDLVGSIRNNDSSLLDPVDTSNELAQGQLF